MPNVDMLGTALGYGGGPNGTGNFWMYLYNPSNFSLIGYLSTTLLCYLALLGGTFVVAHTTYKRKSWKEGWAICFIWILLTYLIPGNIIVLFQEWFAQHIMKRYNLIPESDTVYYPVALFGVFVCAIIIFTEKQAISSLHAFFVSLITHVEKLLPK